MARYHDLTNARFGRLLVVALDHLEGAKKRAYWACRCDCGTEKAIRADGLMSGVVQSCGCLGREKRTAASAAATTTHGVTKGRRSEQRQPPTYRSWAMMKVRCLNEKNHKFKDYGGRGIAVCAEWNKFENFLADMGERPAGTTLDRIDVNGNYEPGNCRWADAKTQRANRRDSVKEGA